MAETTPKLVSTYKYTVFVSFKQTYFNVAILNCMISLRN